DQQGFPSDLQPLLPYDPNARVIPQSPSSSSSCFPSSPVNSCNSDTPSQLQSDWSYPSDLNDSPSCHLSSSSIADSVSQFSYQAPDDQTMTQENAQNFSDGDSCSGESWSYRPISPSSSIHSSITQDTRCVSEEEWNCDLLLASGRSTPFCIDNTSLSSEKIPSSPSLNREKRKSSTSAFYSHTSRSISLRKSKRPPPPPLRSDSLRRRPGRSKASRSSTSPRPDRSPRVDRSTLHTPISSSQTFPDPWVPRSNAKRCQSGLNCGTVTTFFEPLSPNSQKATNTDSDPSGTNLMTPKHCHGHNPGSPSSVDKDLEIAVSHPPDYSVAGLQRLASPSSGYSSQSNTPSPGTPVSSPHNPSSPLTASPGEISLPPTSPFFSPCSSTLPLSPTASSLPRTRSHGKGRPKPPVPQRKSSLLSSSFSSTSSLSSYTSSDSLARQPLLPRLPPPPPLPQPTPTAHEFCPQCVKLRSVRNKEVLQAKHDPTDSQLHTEVSKSLTNSNQREETQPDCDVLNEVFLGSLANTETKVSAPGAKHAICNVVGCDTSPIIANSNIQVSTEVKEPGLQCKDPVTGENGNSITESGDANFQRLQSSLANQKDHGITLNKEMAQNTQSNEQQIAKLNLYRPLASVKASSPEGPWVKMCPDEDDLHRINTNIQNLSLELPCSQADSAKHIERLRENKTKLPKKINEHDRDEKNKSELQSQIDVKNIKRDFQSSCPRKLCSPEKPVPPKKPDLGILGLMTSPKARRGPGGSSCHGIITDSSPTPNTSDSFNTQFHTYLPNNMPSPKHLTTTSNKSEITECSTNTRNSPASSPQRQTLQILHKKLDLSLTSPKTAKPVFASKNTGETFKGTTRTIESLKTQTTMETTNTFETDTRAGNAYNNACSTLQMIGIYATHCSSELTGMVPSGVQKITSTWTEEIQTGVAEPCFGGIIGNRQQNEEITNHRRIMKSSLTEDKEDDEQDRLEESGRKKTVMMMLTSSNNKGSCIKQFSAQRFLRGALLLKKGSRFESSSRISAVERLCVGQLPPSVTDHQKMPPPPLAPAQLKAVNPSPTTGNPSSLLTVTVPPLSPCTLPMMFGWRRRNLMRSQLLLTSNSSSPFLVFSSSHMRSRSLTPPCSSSRRFASRCRLFASPMTAIFEGEDEEEDFVESLGHGGESNLSMVEAS
ncbi:hypothetical protein XENOCAPTIV_022065, partial [Xenoophorus captivus]